jgi:hypothetical protein
MMLLRCVAQHYYKGENSFPQDQTKARIYMPGQQVLVVVQHIMTWVEFMREKEIIRRPSSTLRPPRLWQGMRIKNRPWKIGVSISKIQTTRTSFETLDNCGNLWVL